MGLYGGSKATYNSPGDQAMRGAMQQQEQRTAFEEERSRAMQQQEQRGVPEMRSGINFGPGRANRVPEQGSPEYNQSLQGVRNRRRGFGRRWVRKKCRLSFLSI